MVSFRWQLSQYPAGHVQGAISYCRVHVLVSITNLPLYIDSLQASFSHAVHRNARYLSAAGPCNYMPARVWLACYVPGKPWEIQC